MSKKYGGREGNKPIGQLDQEISTISLAALLSRSWGSTHKIQALGNTVGCCPGFCGLYLACVDLAHYPPSRNIQQSEHEDQDNHEPPASATCGVYTLRNIQDTNHVHTSGETHATYDHRGSTAPTVSIECCGDRDCQHEDRR